MMIILASTSTIRQELLKNANINFETIPPELDERLWKKQNPNLHPREVARRLACAKSCEVSLRHQTKLIIGADQTLSLEHSAFDKPTSLEEAKNQMMELRGKTHYLHAALSCHYQGKEIWYYEDEAKLTMRHFSDQFLENYLQNEGENLLTSVGGYKLEKTGIQLFEEITGNYHTILGLPLLPLLGFLRARGVIAT